jgi:hypothetical protein
MSRMLLSPYRTENIPLHHFCITKTKDQRPTSYSGDFSPSIQTGHMGFLGFLPGLKGFFSLPESTNRL